MPTDEKKGDQTMISLIHLRKQLSDDTLDNVLRTLRCIPAKASLTEEKSRIYRLLEQFTDAFPSEPNREIALCSAPGRTEICGNHTDHQHGCVLAAAVNVDTMACAAPNGTNLIRLYSAGWPYIEVDISQLEAQAEENGTTRSLVRGVMANVHTLGFTIGGFDAVMTSDVLPGSGLSSSAAYEVLIGVIVNHLFCDDRLTALQIAQIGKYAENIYFGKPSGLMDQMASSVGGAVFIDFEREDAPVVETVAVDLAAHKYAMCIVASGADHADLTGEYAAVSEEMCQVARFFGAEYLRKVPAQQFFQAMSAVRAATSDRAVLRAVHFYEENERVRHALEALGQDRFDQFLSLVSRSGQSSWRFLQNIDPNGGAQPMAYALAAAEHALAGRGACRVHGGGFAGTIQAFVPLEMVNSFRTEMDAALFAGACSTLSIRPIGGCVLTPSL